MLVESGLHVIFDWQPFRQNFTSGTKTIISIIVSYVFVTALGLDVVSRLVAIFSSGPTVSTGFFGRFITALIIAGGSSGVNNLMRSLGVRAVATPEQMAPKPPANEGWISVTLVRDKAVGPVDVLIGDPSATPVVGSINRPAISEFWRYFRRDPGRYPPSGGYSVKAGENCKVMLQGGDQNGSRISATWGPSLIGARAIVDLELKL